jgi:predicted transcriptional regulator
MDKIDIHAVSQSVAMRTRALKITQSDIAEAISADQSQVSRILSGKSKRPSRVFTEVCNYVNSRSPSIDKDLVRQNDELIDAIASVWDGTTQHAVALSNVIRSLSSLSKTACKDTK